MPARVKRISGVDEFDPQNSTHFQDIPGWDTSARLLHTATKLSLYSYELRQGSNLNQVQLESSFQ